MKLSLSHCVVLVAVSIPPAGYAQAPTPSCPISEAIRHPDHTALTEVANRLVGGHRAKRAMRVVALGSSSTQGYGAASPDQSYPHRLQVELSERLPGLKLSVINAGVGGETISMMTRRLSADVLAHDPDLVIWQVGSNALLQEVSHDKARAGLIEGIKTLQENGVPLILMGMQFAPRIVENTSHRSMRKLIIQTGEQYKVPVFDRYGLMQFWESELSAQQLDDWTHPDGLHMTDASYRCLAIALAEYLLAMRHR